MTKVRQGDFVSAPRDEDAPYFPERLKARLRNAPALRGLFIEAPSGYGKTTVVSDWVRHGPSAAFDRRLFTQAIPFAHLCRARCLLLDGKPEILLGERAAVLDLAAALHSAPALIYAHIHSAAARAMRGEAGEAATALRAALDLALPDALYLPFAENYDLIGPLLAKALSGKDPKEALSRVKALARRMQAGRLAVARKLYAENDFFGLSSREYATARLAALGLSNPVIAKRLSVTVNTVKAHLKSVYRKSRAQSRLDLYRLFAEREKTERDS
jgi:LuxR family maltose regulon positive regulatory protein